MAPPSELALKLAKTLPEFTDPQWPVGAGRGAVAPAAEARASDEAASGTS